METSPDGSAGAEGEGPPSGRALSRLNATRHGLLAKQTVLPWEDRSDYDALLAALLEEHRPFGPTQEHLVEELAGIVWRKRRLRLAEAASYRHGFKRAVEGYYSRRDSNATARAALLAVGRPERLDDSTVADALLGDPEARERAVRAYRAALESAERALAVLDEGGAEAYERALGALEGQAREMWEERLAALLEAPGMENIHMPEVLSNWLRSHIKPAIEPRLIALIHREAIRDQAIGDAFDGEKLRNIARYETHLDRRLERILSVLVKLQELRRERGEGGE